MAFERRGVERSTRFDGLDQITVRGPRDAVDVVWAAIELVQSLLVDDAVGGSGRSRRDVVAERWSCDIRASVMVEHGGHACDEGRATRIVNRRLRRALHRRDGGMCRFPGCGATSWLHAHHIVHWADNGRTDLDNLVSLCGFHHTLVHEGDWAVAFADGAIVWSDPDGVPATIEPAHGNADRLVDGQRLIGITPRTIESEMTNARLEVHFVVSVLAEHIARQRRRLRGDVSAET